MALRRFDIEAGGDTFAFKPETEDKIVFWLAKYPVERKRSAVIPMLWLAQKDNNGWLSEPAMREVADRLEMPYIRVYEVATFYTMFRLQPVGKFHVQLCGTTPCMLRGAEDLKSVCEEEIGPKMYITDDERLSWEEVECLGACANAPMVQINDDYYEDLTADSLQQILSRLRNGAEVSPGPQVDRVNSAPEGGTSLLTEPFLFDGSANSSTVLPNLGGGEPEVVAPTSPPKAQSKAMPKEKAPTNTKREDIGMKPEIVNIAVAERDNLKEIKGIGPKNEQALFDLGIATFRQIAAWTPENIDWVEDFMSFPGRIERESWIAQAKDLAAGKTTEFSARVKAGDVESSKGED